MSRKSVEARDIFIHAVENIPQNGWREYLAEACGTDTALQRKVRRLLDAHVTDGSFMDKPAAARGATIGQSTVLTIGTHIGPYTLREQIGEGGMGVVYVAEQSEPIRRKVALKIIRPGMATKAVLSRFEAERQALALMNHENIARVFDGGSTEGGQPYFVMELVQGLSITEYCNQHHVRPRERLAMFVTVCRAVQHAHQKGIIHRDLKPSNVLVSRIDNVAVPKVIDFGVAKAINQKLSDRTVYTQFQQLVGTPLYMSPEQVELGVVDIDTRSDVYSLGVLLYQLLTNCTPFDRQTLDAANFDETRRIIRDETPQRPSVRVSTLKGEASSTLAEFHGLDSHKLSDLLRGELDWVVMKALEKDRDRRYESCSAMAEDVERFLKDEPVFARPPSVSYRVRKFARRNRALVMSIATVCIAIGLVIAAMTTGFIKERKQVGEKQKLIKLFADLIGTPYGTETRAKSVTLRESLDKLEGDLSERFANSPAVEIEARKIFGRAYRRYTEHEKADKHLETALRLAEQHYGPHDKEVADVLTLLADDVQWHAGKSRDVRKSQQYARRAYAIYDRLGTVEDTDILYILGFSLSSNIDDSQEAEGYLRRNLAKARRKANGKDANATVFALWDLAMHLARTRQGHEREVRQLMDEAVAMSERVHADVPTTLARAISAYGHCLFMQGMNEESLKCYQRTWDIHKQNGFETEDGAVQAAFWMAELNLVAHRHREGRKIHDQIEAFAREREQWGYVADFHHGRAFGDLLRDDYKAAAQNLRQAIQLTRRHRIEYHGLNAMVRIKLACLLEAKGKIDEAQKLCSELTSFLQPQFFSLNEWSPEFYYVRARALLCLGNLDEAYKTAEEGLVWAEKGPAHRHQPHLQLIRAIILNRRGDRDGAIRLLRKTLETIPFSTRFSISSTGPKSRRELESMLAQYLMDAGDFDAACEVYQDGIAGREAQLPDEPTDAENLPITLAKLRYGLFLFDQRKFNLAEKQLSEAYEQLSTDREAAPATIERAARKLVDLYTETGRPDEAAIWQEKLTDGRPPGIEIEEQVENNGRSD